MKKNVVSADDVHGLIVHVEQRILHKHFSVSGGGLRLGDFVLNGFSCSSESELRVLYDFLKSLRDEME